MNQPNSPDTWTDKQFEEHQARLWRHKQLASNLISLTIQKHGGFSLSSKWIGLGLFEPGNVMVQVDGALTIKDLEILKALLQLPSMEYEDLETFDWTRFEAIRDDLKRSVIAMGLKPDLGPVGE